ncbi:hypothetical protein L0128_12710 [candidate division KSB1 bacterium]|nr:hypothetical protein [candidate division KSB1 bacterium]
MTPSLATPGDTGQLYQSESLLKLRDAPGSCINRTAPVQQSTKKWLAAMRSRQVFVWENRHKSPLKTKREKIVFANEACGAVFSQKSAISPQRNEITKMPNNVALKAELNFGNFIPF